MLLALALAAAGCSSGGGDGPGASKSPLGAIEAATTAAGAGAITGTVVADGANGRLTGRWDGATIPRGSGDVVAALDARTELKLRWIAGKLYLARTGAVPAALTGAAGSLLGPAGSWRVVPANAVARTLVTPFAPPALVRALRASDATVRTSPGPKIGGAKTEHLAITADLGLLFVWGNPKVDLWTDEGHRVVRVRLVSGTSSVRYDVGYHAIRAVTAPTGAKGQSSNPDAALAPTGPYVEWASGEDAGLRWRVLRAPGNRGTECWRVEGVPPVTMRSTDAPDQARCLAPPDPTDAPEDQVVFPVLTDGATPHAVFAAQLPAGSQAVIGFVGSATTRPLHVVGDVAVWAGPAEPAPGYLGVTLPDGTKLDCGVGAISAAGDLTDPSLAADAYAAPWTCVPA